MSTKHIFNDSEGLVVKALRGAVALNPDLRLHVQTKCVYTKTRSNARVALISGGGAGHEPAHAGYTGRGMLAASVSGDIFASPSASQVLTCIRLAFAVQGTNEALLIVNNYTGDRLNFGLAAERAYGLSIHSKNNQGSTERSKVRVETVVVADDISLLDRPSLVGARGLAGNILVCKILGAAAEQKFTLDELKRLGDAVVSNLASIGVGLAHCHVPGRKDNPGTVVIEDGMCELGLGLHNEAGARRMEIGSEKKLIGEMIEQILDSPRRKGKSTGGIEEGKQFVQVDDNSDLVDEVVLYVNNLGGMSTLEMSAIVDEAISQLEPRGIHPARVLLSSFMTSLNAPGFSLSLLNLSATCRDYIPPEHSKTTIGVSTLLHFVDFPTDATAWAAIRSNWPGEGKRRDRAAEDEEASHLLATTSVGSSEATTSSSGTNGSSNETGWSALGTDAKQIESGIRGACDAVLLAENELTRFDTIIGDGDCGETFSSGARAVLRALDRGQLDVSRQTPSELMAALSELLLSSMGGTSGALFGLYFTALANVLQENADLSPSGEGQVGTTSMERAPLAALQSISAHTPARPGDRTLVDALSPFCDYLAAGEGLRTAVKKAREGAETTRGMRARLGRATYVDGGSTDSDLVLPPDPGAWGVAALLEGLVQGLQV